MMTLKIVETLERDPWDVFADKFSPENLRASGIQDESGTVDVASLCRSFAKWLESENEAAGACILCERRFRKMKGENNGA